MAQSKRCPTCGEEKPLSGYYVRKATGRPEPQCKACRRAATAAYTARNYEQVRARDRRRYRSMTPEKRAKESQRLSAYRQTERGRAWYREYAKRTSGIAVARAKAWAKANPERAYQLRLEATRRRRARLGGLKITGFSHEQIAAKVAYWGDKCWMCGGLWDGMDHVKPVSKGGLHVLANLRPACEPCNSRKHAHWPYPTARRRPA